jgi:hypothetical protein
MAQLHKRFTDEQIRDMLKRYLNHEIERAYLQAILGVGKSRFFKLLSHYRKNPDAFSILYHRSSPVRLDPRIEKNILKELKIDQRSIENPKIPLRHYNYSYVKQRLQNHYHQHASLPTIIDRAKKHGFYKKRKPHKAHDREVLTRYVGELIQHDSSYHLWAPAADRKWYLITSLDDFSRYLFFAKLFEYEIAWIHIEALQNLASKHGFPYSYYVDSHSIFRFVRGRDPIHQYQGQTDAVDTQWQQVLGDCGIKVIHALSPQAKGKIERPYRWLQDHLIRTCIREDVSSITQANRILYKEVHDYNYKRVHSTTGEIPYLRFQRALKQKQSLFRSFAIRPPFKSAKDIFCFRIQRTTDAYRRVSVDNLIFKVNGISHHQPVTLRIAPRDRRLAEVRFWHNDNLIDVQTVKISELKGVHF